jgi:DNA-binding transcriptional regulator LsrR (DeoR family)
VKSYPNEDQNSDPAEMLGAAGARFIMNQINENNITEFGIGTGSTIMLLLNGYLK